MLQIRLRSIGSSDSAAAASSGATAGGAGGGGGAPAKAPAAPAAAAEVVTVACPDHLVIADLPVAKSLGAVTASAAAASRTVGRRSRRPLGERVHICSRCDFPVAIYGRLIPCEHAFCLTCARSDSSCYLCEERIQKIQSVKMMEGIFICAAPLCLKSFLKRADFESHVPEAHANLLQTNGEKEGRNELDAPSISRASMGDTQKQSQLPEISTARAPPRAGVSPTSSSHIQDREEWSRHHQSRDQPPLKLPVQPKPPAFHGRQPYPPGDSQPENNPPQGFDRPYNWAPQPPNLENAAGPPQLRQESDHVPQDKQPGVPNPPFIYPPMPPHQPNFAMPMNMNQPLVPNPSFNYPPLQQDGTQQYFGTPFQMQMPDAGLDQGSVLGVPPASSGALNFPEGLQRPWGMGLMGMPFQPMPLGQGVAEGVTNPGDPQGGLAFFQAGFGAIPDSSLNPNMPGRDHQGGHADHGEGKGVLAPPPMPMQNQMPLPPLPPPPQPPSSAQQPFNRS